MVTTIFKQTLLGIIKKQGACAGVVLCQDCPLVTISIYRHSKTACTCKPMNDDMLLNSWVRNIYTRALEFYVGTFGKDVDLLEILI